MAMNQSDTPLVKPDIQDVTRFAPAPPGEQIRTLVFAGPEDNEGPSTLKARTSGLFVAGGDLEEGSDKVDGGNVQARVGGGTDRFFFTGSLEDLQLTGEASVFVDGQKVDPSSIQKTKPEPTQQQGGATTNMQTTTVGKSGGMVDTEGNGAVLLALAAGALAVLWGLLD